MLDTISHPNNNYKSSLSEIQKLTIEYWDDNNNKKGMDVVIIHYFGG